MGRCIDVIAAEPGFAGLGAYSSIDYKLALEFIEQFDWVGCPADVSEAVDLLESAIVWHEYLEDYLKEGVEAGQIDPREAERVFTFAHSVELTCRRPEFPWLDLVRALSAVDLLLSVCQHDPEGRRATVRLVSEWRRHVPPDQREKEAMIDEVVEELSYLRWDFARAVKGSITKVILVVY